MGNLHKDLFTMAAPVCFLVTVQLGLGLITLIFAGRIDEETLAGVGIANTFYNVLQYAIMLGFSSVMDTYGPQVYGSREKKHLSTVLLKVMLQGVLVWLLLIGPYLNLAYVMRLVSPHQLTHFGYIGHYGLRLLGWAPQGDMSWPDDSYGERVVEKGVLYLRLTSVMGLLDFLYDIISKYLTIQLQMRPVYCSTALMVAVHVLFTYALTVWSSFGIYGLALACILTRLTALIFVLLYMLIVRRDLAWAGWSPLVWSSWSEMVKLGVSGAVNVSAEYGMYEISTFLSQFKGITVLNTIIIMFQITGIPFGMAYGVAYASSVLIGIALADHDRGNAVKVRNMTVFYVACIGSATCAILMVLRDDASKIFTDDEAVRNLTASVMWVPAVTVIFENLQTCLSRGVLTGLGKQRFIAVALVTICYGIATPYIIATVVWTDWGALGILSGFLLFSVVSCFVNGVRVAMLDFDVEIEKVAERVKSTAGQDDDELIIMNENQGVSAADDLDDDECLDPGEVERTADTAELCAPGVEVVNGRGSKKLFLFVGAFIWTSALASVSFLKELELLS